MPIYEYLCDSCGNRIEALQKISDEPLKICSACGSTSLRKLVSAASFRLKGKGWYETDFKTGDKKKLAESDSKSEDKSNGQSNEKGTDKAVNKKSEDTVKTKTSTKGANVNDSVAKKSKSHAEAKSKEQELYMRSHFCGELNESNVDEDVVLKIITADAIQKKIVPYIPNKWVILLVTPQNSAEVATS